VIDDSCFAGIPGDEDGRLLDAELCLGDGKDTAMELEHAMESIAKQLD